MACAQKIGWADSAIGARETGLDTVLVVDDQDAVRRAFARVLQRAGYRVLSAADAFAALAIIEAETIDAVVSDISMPQMDGIALLRAIRDLEPDLPVVFATGEPSIESAAEAIEHGATKYLRKPVMPDTLLQAVVNAIGVGRARRDSAVSSQRMERQRAELQHSFDTGIDKLWMAFQPIICWSKQATFGYEALLRTDHEPLRSPLDFIEAAESLGVTELLGRAVRNDVGRRALEAPPGAELFVNLHPRDLRDEELYDPSGPLGHAASRIVLEVTERASLEDLGDVKAMVRRLRDCGYRIAIDDLGAGYASLSAIALIEPDVVKLDMTLIRSVDSLPTKQRMVRAMTSLSSELGAKVVAEGVETEAERDCLVDLGCDLLQGWLFARPQRDFHVWSR